MLTPDQARTIAESLFGSTTDPPPLANLQTVGPYRIVRELARGGMGVVYLATRSEGSFSEETEVEASVAIKVIHASHSSLAAKDRLRRETAILERLNHPSIAKILGAGTLPEDGRPWFAMEYVVAGLPITEFARTRSLDRRATINLFLKVCEAVEHGHQKGIIHRDLKPSNILIDQVLEIPKVIDFGVARSTDIDIAATTTMTSVGEVVGTLRYMSPEQCEGDPTRIETRTDIYALGVILHELLCGRMPYEVPTHSIFAAANAIRTQPPLLDTDHTLDGTLATILRTALAKDAASRYRSVDAFGRDLRSYLDGDPIAAAPPGVWTRTTRWVARHPTLTAIALFACLSCVTIASGLLTRRYLQNVVEIVRRQDSRYLDLCDGLGFTHRTFDSHMPRGIDAAELLPRDEAHGHPPLLLLAMSHDAPVEHAGKLLAYAPDGGEQPLWISGVRATDCPDTDPETVAKVNAGRFFIHSILIADVFPDLPGDEIIAVHDHSPGPFGVVRVIDRDGSLLYQSWHRGAIRAPFWSPAARQLCITGWNNEGAWEDRVGGERMPAGVRPLFICGLRPTNDGGTSRWIATGDAAREHERQPAWYRVLLPSRFAECMNDGVHFFFSPRSQVGSGIVRFEMHVGGSGEGVTVVIDGEGNEIIGERMPSDSYRQNPKLPPVSETELLWGPMPPRCTTPVTG
ncbi:MAG: serine/threonine protein kinase [Phycisphaerae bacterium]|nr:serine/threonine protein kinase [Phycisphaerae bacterium]